MVRKVTVKKKVIPKKIIRKAVKKPIIRTSSEVRAERVLVENFVSLQRVMVNLSAKFDNLATQISKLLELFEISAKALAEKETGLPRENLGDKRVIEKLDNLTDQNKILARGVALLHERDFPSESSIRPPPTNISPQLNIRKGENIPGSQQPSSSRFKSLPSS